MRINDTTIFIQKKDTHNFEIFRTDKDEKFTLTPALSPFYDEAKEIYNHRLRKEDVSEEAVEKLLTSIRNYFTSDACETEVAPPEEAPTVKVKRGLEGLMKFFTEFQFEPNFRFVNSFAHALASSDKSGKEYIANYFELIDSPYVKEVREKIKSPEFKAIITDIKAIAPTSTINKRFKLYYGSQGTGKTTIAMGETDNRCMVCNSSMLPADLMEDFVFIDGKATFKPSALWRCMVEGKPIVLDELNLLPFDSLRFLQTILDGKTEFLYKGNRIEIADGFCTLR